MPDAIIGRQGKGLFLPGMTIPENLRGIHAVLPVLRNSSSAGYGNSHTSLHETVFDDPRGTGANRSMMTLFWRDPGLPPHDSGRIGAPGRKTIGGRSLRPETEGGRCLTGSVKEERTVYMLLFGRRPQVGGD